MGLAKRIIPTLLFRGDALVKGLGYNSWRSVGHVVQAAKIYGSRGVDEIMLLDIGATPERRGPDLKIVEKVATDFFTPLTVGGGVRGIADVRDLLNAGADKVSICTAAMDDPEMLGECSVRFGRQAIVAAVDVRNDQVVSHCGTQGKVFWERDRLQARPVRAVEWAKALEENGAGEIVLSAVERDGALVGYDLDLIARVAAAVDVPVVASGGCKGYDDMHEAFKAGASAAAAGALFQFTDCTPKGAAKYLAALGVETRI